MDTASVAGVVVGDSDILGQSCQANSRENSAEFINSFKLDTLAHKHVVIGLFMNIHVDCIT